MKNLGTIIYLLLFFFSASLHEKEIILFENTQSIQSTIVSIDSSHCNTTSSHQSGEKNCLSCHLGHCSVIFLNQESATKTAVQQSYPKIKSHIHLYNYQLGQFRPPIA